MIERRPPKPATPETRLVLLRSYVPPELWQEAMDRAEAAGMSVSRYLRELVQRDQVDENGRPVWAPVPEGEQLALAS